jgi:aminopeptidase
MRERESLPLVQAVYAEIIRAGARPYVEFQSDYLDRELLNRGSDELLNQNSEMQEFGMEWADVYIGLRGARNPFEFSGVSAQRIAAFRRMMGKISALRTEQTRWVLARIPNETSAQLAGISLEEMMTYYFNSTLRNWPAESERYKAYKKIFQSAEDVRITGLDTDLYFSTKGRTYIIEDGRINMPGGEIFTAPIEASAEGYIFFDKPCMYAGQFIEGIRLQFSQGQVESASAQKNEDLLLRVLDMDEGAKRIGEFGVGTNSGMDRFCNDFLLDEKMFGTVHIALGRAYSECGGLNKSDLHWDLIKDLRKEGQIYLNGQLVFQNGAFIE